MTHPADRKPVAHENRLEAQSANSHFCRKIEPIYVALAIIGVIGIAACGAGLAGFGASQAWWSVGSSLSQLGQSHVILMAVGGATLIGAALISVRKYLERPNGQPNDFHPEGRERSLSCSSSSSESSSLLSKPLSSGRLSSNLSVEAEGPQAAEVASRNRIAQAWEVFNYDLIAEHKYQVVLDEYVHAFGRKKLKKIYGEIEENACRNNVFLTQLKQVLRNLIYSEEKGARESYKQMVQALRLAIESNEYRAILNAGEELSEQDKSRKGFIRKLCLVRWKEVHLYNYLNDSVLLTIGRDELGVDGDYPDVILRINREIKNSSFNKKPALHLETQKLSGALGIEDFCGTKNTPHVRNIQHFKNNKGESLRISYVRHGTPTALEGRVNTARQVAAPFGRFLGLDMDGGEEVTSDYREYLRALEDEGESELFCVHQRRTPNVIENERSRVKKIEALQEQHPNLFVLTQPVEGDLFEHKGDYSQISSFEDLKMSLREEFFERDLEDPQTRAALPCCLRNNEEYKLAFNQLLKDVQELFFPNKEFAIAPNMMDSLANVQKELEKKQFEAIKVFLLEHSTDDLQNQEEPKSTVEIDVRVLERLLQDNDLNDHFGENISVENLQQRIYLAAKSVKKLEKTEDLESENLKTWQSYILLFYIFQKMDLKFRLNGVNGFSLTAYTTPCKDFLDRGGNQAFVERRLLDYMMGMGNDEERKEEALINLLGPPILVKKKEAIERRIKPGLEVEKLLASMDQERITKLVNYTFGDEKWRIVEIATPKLKAQTGMPLLSRHIKNEITNIQPNEVVACIRKYAHYDLDQWERVCVREIQGKGLEIGSNSINVLTRSQRNRNPKDIRALKGQVLEHKLVNHDEPKAEKILSSLSQCFNIVHDSISETFNEAITANVLAVVNQQTEGTFLVDLSRDDVISIRYTDPSFVLKRQDQEEIIATCEAEVEIQYRKGEEPEGYMHWTLKPID